jgi:hypothetical protein
MDGKAAEQVAREDEGVSGQVYGRGIFGRSGNPRRRAVVTSVWLTCATCTRAFACSPHRGKLRIIFLRLVVWEWGGRIAGGYRRPFHVLGV